MIDVSKEHLLKLSELARLIPPGRNGRPVSPSTIFRWRSPGLRGVKLDAIRIGGAWLTSLEKYQAFCEELTRAELSTPAATDAESERGDIAETLDREGL